MAMHTSVRDRNRKRSKETNSKSKAERAAPTATKGRGRIRDPQPEPKHFRGKLLTTGTSLGGGAVLTVGLFIFLGWLQPVLKGSEKVDLPEVIKIQLANPQTKAPPPPPQPKEQPKEKPPRKTKRPRRTERPVVGRQTTPRTVRRPANSASHIRPEIASALQGVGLPSMGAGGGGAVVSLPVGDEYAAVAAEEMEYAEYNRQRELIRDATFQAQQHFQTMIASGDISAPTLSYQPKPRYPVQAKKNEIEGFVAVRLLISVTGNVQKFEIIKAQPEGIFEDSIEEVLPRWQFAPAKDSQGRPIESWMEYNYVFELKDAI